MEKTIIFASVALATLFAFSSCQKEILQDNGSTNGVRIITAEFENNATKTELNDDGKTPEWAVGDVLRILNGTSYQDVTLAAGDITDNKITFTTTLTGTLYAVYPALATTMTSCSDGNINFTIPAIQDGTFASANICVAKSTEEDENNKDNLIFSNATAVLKVTTAADVVGVDVTAANKIAGNVTASFDGSAVSLTTTALDKNYVSAVGSSAPTGNVFYLAVAPVETGSTDVNCYKTETKGSENKSSKELQRNIIYSMDLSSLTIDNSDLTGQRGILNGHEYVVVKCGDKNLKWATMNVGATTLTGTGDYYMWGAVEKPYSSLSSMFPFKSEKPSSYINDTWAPGNGWTGLNCQFTTGIEELSQYGFGKQDVFTKYSAGKDGYSATGTADGKTVLESEDDAATYNWGSTWRMPEGGNESEFLALYNATYWSWDDTDKGYYVYAPNPSTDAGKYKDGGDTYNKSDALLFFPAGGMGTDNRVYGPGSLGAYWTRTLNSEKPFEAHHFTFATDTDSGVSTAVTSHYRFSGLLIRPVSD